MDAHPIHKGIVAGAIIDALNGDFAAFMDIGLAGGGFGGFTAKLIAL